MGRIGIRQYTLLAILALTAVIVATFVVQKTILTQAAPGINKTINFQGKMTNASGLNVPNGTYQFVFRLYNVASGGSAAWTETVSLPVTDGIFHHNLGSVSALPGSVDFDTDNIFLGITFNSDPAGEMSPRVQLTASPYAFNSDKLDGLDASAFLQLDPSTAQLGSIAITGNMSAGGTATASRFISNVATGTAPLTVTSTTMVANLNADLLDGQHGAYYRNASNINAGTLSDARLSANVSLLGQTIGFSELEANSVDSSKVVNNSLTADDLAANSVDSSEIVDGSVDESHLNITNAPTAGNVLQFGGSNNFTWVNPATLPTSGVSSLNTLTGSLTLQGNAQVGVSSAGSVISLSIQNDSIGDAQLAFNTGQHLTVTSSPTFAGLTVNGDITMAGSNTLDLNSGRIAFAKSGLNKFSNLAAFDTSGNVTGAIVIKTNIPRNSRMNWVRFKGYNYTSNPILDLTIAGYWYNSGYSWNNRGFVNNGGRTPSNVQFGVDSSDNVVIIIGSTTDTWSYPHFLVDEWVIGTGNASNADASNWQIAVEDDLSAYSNTVAVANDSFTPYDPQYVNVTGDTMTGALTVNSTVTATLFSGSGASLTNLNASNLASGTVPNARISGSYTGFTNVTGTGNADFARFLGNGADTAASPSFTWSNDTNTGVFRGGADILGFSTAGTESMRILANGNVGIGTTSPTAKLMLSGSGANNDGILRIQSTSGGGDGALVKLGEFNYLNQDNSGAGYFSWGASFDGDTNQFVRQYTSNPAYLGFVKLGTTNGDVSIGSSTSNLQADTNPTMSTSLTVKGGTGYVGIGTASPSTALHVNGTATATLFSGSGASLTNLNGSNISTGTVANARLTGSGALTVTAGNGLTGGGSVALGSSTSLAIGAGSCITVGATNVGVTDNCVNAATVGGVASGSLVQLQPTTPGTAQTGNINISGTAIAGSFSGNGSGLTNLNGSNISTGTIANARLTGSGALTVTAGNGLTGGGSVALGGTTTLTVGAGDGILVNATNVAVNSTVCRTTGNCAGANGYGDILQGGNSFGTAMTIGTNDNNALHLETNGSTKLTVLANGNVGIGTTTPSAKLEVSGTAIFGGNYLLGNSQYYVNHNLGSVTGGPSVGGAYVLLERYATNYDMTSGTIVGVRTSSAYSHTVKMEVNSYKDANSGAARNISLESDSAPFHDVSTKRVTYNGVEYTAIYIPESEAQRHPSNFAFTGWHTPSGDSLKVINGNDANITAVNDLIPFRQSTKSILSSLMVGGDLSTGGITRLSSTGILQNVTYQGNTIANSYLTGSGALTVTAGSGLTGGGSVALGGSTTINVGADAITDTHLAFNTGQHLTVTSTPTFSSLNLGSSGVLRFGGTAGYAYTSKPRYTVDNTTLLSDFDNYSRSLSFIENTASGHGYYGTYDTLKLYTNNAGIQYFYQYNGVTADTPIRYRTADYSGSGWNDWRSIASQEWANTNLVRIQGSTPGTAQSGHLNITGTAIAGSFSGNGSLLTNLNASNITSGTLAVARGGTGATTAAGARTNLGATTVGANFFTLTNPSAVTFARINADNTVSALSAADFRAAIGAGTGGGSVTSINVSGGTTGLTTSGGPITSSGTITLGGTLGVANGGTGASTAQAAINNISGLTTAGDLLYHNGSNSTRLARGTNGQCLTSNASTILWGSCGGGISGSGSNGQVSFWTGAGSQGGSSNFFWNNSTSSLGLGTASPSARLHVDGGSILATGTHGGGNGITVTGAGTRMFFDVNKSAFRAGYVDGNQWNNANVGNWSIALGYNTTASGGISTALGWDAIASGDTSIAIGAGAAASGDTSIAIGAGVTASSWASTALGQGTTASGSRSTAFGAQTTASGSDSTTFGTATTASGTSSTAFGFATTAQAYASTVLGRYNVIQGSTTSWVGTDQLFVVGNGSDASNRSNALTVLKNGNVGIGIASPSVALDVSGTVAATLFSGSGASLTNLNASSITSGTLAVARGGTGASTAQAAINNLSGLTASGDLLYYNGTNATRLARGTNGQCLTSNASTILWGACGGGGITTVGTFSTTNTHAGGATISGSQIIFQAASTTAPGMVSISNQSFVGDKTFTGSTTLGDASNDTLTINGTNVLIPNNLNIDSNTLFIDSTNNRIGIGTTSLAEGKLVVQSSSHGNESSSGIVSRINVTGEPSPSNAPSNYAGYFQATLSGHEIREGETVGVYGSVVADSPFSLWSGEMIGVKGFASLQNDTYYANLYGLQGGVSASSSSWAASAYGLHIKSAQVSSGGVIHDNYGIYIQNQTAGNNDYGLYIQGADTYALWVGSGASRLDGTLEVNGSSSGGSNAPLALDVQGGNATGSYSCTTPTFGLSGQCGYNGGGSSIIGGGGTSGLDGPNTSNAAAGGNGGEILIEGGAGGNVSGLYSISGSGGDIIIQGGAAGTGGTLSGSNGNVLLARDRGSVGIGTASPTELLHVAGNIRFTGRVQGDDGTVSLPAYTFQSDTNTGLYRPGSDILGVTTGGTEVARFTSGQLQMNNGTAAAPAFSFSSDADVGLYRAGTNIMGVTTAGTEVARFTSTQFAVVNGTAATPAITFTSDTNTGIFRSQADALAISSGGSVMFEVNTGGANVQGLFAVATLGGGQSTHVCWGGFGILSTCSSSARYKKDIATANWGLDQIRQLRPVTYNWKEDGRAGFGFIAEEVAQISPYFAFHHNGQIEGVNYSELTSVLAAGIKQLDVIVHNEKTRLDGVVSVNQMQQATLSNLMAGMNGLEMGISQVQDQLSAGAFSSLNITGPASIQNLQVVNNLTVGNNLTVSNRIITKHITISGHVRTAGDTPTFELGTTLDVLGAVIELSGLTVEVSGNDTSGTIRLITEDDPVGLEEGHLAQFNFANKFDTRPRVMLSSANAAATKAGLFVDNEQVTDKYFRLFGTDQLAPNSTYELNYWIVE